VAAGARVIALGFPASATRAQALPLVRRLATAGAATLLLNGFNFALGLLLVRRLAPRTFGVWAMLTTLQGLAGVLLTALVAQQMAHVLPRLHHPARQRASALVFASVAAWCVMAFVPVTAVTLYALDLPLSVVATGSVFVAAAGIRSHARFHLYALRRPRAVLTQDVVYVTLAAGGVALIGWRKDLTALLLVLTLANVAAVAWRSQAQLPMFGRVRVRWPLVAYRRHAARAWWSLVTVALSTVSALSPNLALASTGALAALATVAAPTALLAPLRLVALTFQASLRAEYAALIHAGRQRAAMHLYAGASGLALLACLLLAVALWQAWPWLGPRVFARGYDHALLARATTLAFATAAVNVVRLPGAVLLNVLGVFRFSAATLVAVVPVVVVLACWLAHRGAVVAVLYPALAGEAAMLVAELVALRRRLR
jgi:O-antigen/teichoic acid export membrane protein